MNAVATPTRPKASSKASESPQATTETTVITGETRITEGGELAANLALWCSHDIETLANEVTLLGEECTASGEGKIGALLRCYGIRIEQLNSAIMSFLSRDSVFTMSDMHHAHIGHAKFFTPEEHANG